MAQVAMPLDEECCNSGIELDINQIKLALEPFDR
jgi:hypothetical protein